MTTSANAFMSKLHDRIPVMLETESVTRWLDPQANPDELQSLLVPAADGVLTAHPVSRRINSPKNNDEELIEPATAEPPAGQGGLFG